MFLKQNKLYQVIQSFHIFFCLTKSMWTTKSKSWLLWRRRTSDDRLWEWVGDKNIFGLLKNVAHSKYFTIYNPDKGQGCLDYTVSYGHQLWWPVITANKCLSINGVNTNRRDEDSPDPLVVAQNKRPEREGKEARERKSSEEFDKKHTGSGAELLCQWKRSWMPVGGST